LRATLCMVTAILMPSAGIAQDGSDMLAAAAQHAGVVGVNSHLNNRKSSRSVRATQNLRAVRAAQTCANLPKARARLGADNPNIQGLERACRQAGFL